MNAVLPKRLLFFTFWSCHISLHFLRGSEEREKGKLLSVLGVSSDLSGRSSKSED
jgi:hypothetical protein